MFRERPGRSIEIYKGLGGEGFETNRINQAKQSYPNSYSYANFYKYICMYAFFFTNLEICIVPVHMTCKSVDHMTPDLRYMIYSLKMLLY